MGTWYFESDSQLNYQIILFEAVSSMENKILNLLSTRPST